jgi:serine O-acetyltransferase
MTSHGSVAVSGPGLMVRRWGRLLLDELDVIVARDPSVRSRWEALLHPSLVAVLGHRVAHRLYLRGLLRTARGVGGLVRLFSGGIEIHPGARIGRRLFIDHGCGVVIGETAVVGDDVTLFHQVTLGATGAPRAVGRRHPRLGNGVLVGANATLLGPITVGDQARIGAQALVVSDVPAGGSARAPKAVVRTPAQRLAA